MSGHAHQRGYHVFSADSWAEAVIGRAHNTLEVIEFELDGRAWIPGSATPTIADVALYSYIDHSRRGRDCACPLLIRPRLVEAVRGAAWLHTFPTGDRRPFGGPD